MLKLSFLIALCCIGAVNVYGDANTYEVSMTDLQTGKSVGTITATSSPYGVVLTPDLAGLPQGAAGLHGFHVHTNPSCAATKTATGETVPGGAAGGHLDPLNTNNHGFPWGDNNHLGDLPALFLASDGTISSPVLAPRLKLTDLNNRSLMIHVGGDTYSDHPHHLGGGGARMICGVISTTKS